MAFADGSAELSPPTAAAQSKSNTRRRILDAARVVFARDGYLEANLADIAAEAGLGKSSLYRHVESKAELFVEVLIDQAVDHSEPIEAILEQSETAEEALRGLAKLHLAFWRANPQYRLVVTAIDCQDLIGEIRPQIVARVRAMWEVPLRALCAVIRRGIERGEFRPCDPWATAHVVWNLGNLLYELTFSHERRRLLAQPLEHFFEESLELVVQGLRNPDARSAV